MSRKAASAHWTDEKPKRRQTRFLKRFIVSSDSHSFIGRLYDLGIVSMHFDSYDELAKYPDCKYVVDTVSRVEALTRRVESLNLAGNMLWPEPFPDNFNKLPITRYEWLTVTADLFIIRYVSVIDCAFLLINQVLEAGLADRDCIYSRLKRAGLPDAISSHLKAMLDAQQSIRDERNMRIHHGLERSFTDDDVTFKLASSFTDRGSGMTGFDYYGRPINLDISFKEGLVWMQKDFVQHANALQDHLDALYDLLWPEFEDRFGPLVAVANHGLNAGARRSRS